MFDPKLLLPEKIYAVAGFEINIYFQNVVTVINPANYAFDVECEKGRCDQERWRWTPAEEDTGEHKLKLSVWSDEGLLAEAETTIIVSPRNAGEGKTLTILQIGASCMAAKGHGESLMDRFQLPQNPRLVMLGSHSPGYTPVVPGGPANEAFGGWSWRTFFEKEKSYELDNDGLHPKRPWDVPSPFLFDRNGKKEFDFQAYIDTVCHGVKPDVVYFELGVNGTFLAKTDAEFEEMWQRDLYPYMKRMIDSVKAVLPDAVLGVEQIPRGSWSQDSFGKNYGCLQSRRRWLINADLLFRKYAKLASEMGYLIIPDYHNADGTANYPVEEEALFAGSNVMVKRPSNALHACADGYGQWADCEYFFLKYLMAQGLVK
ncbi:MAG: hypothetical protein E7048_01675 [Lentisphaerae bacterium]|nr:hypothetical protein [Lentisphaerota bacterium]